MLLFFSILLVLTSTSTPFTPTTPPTPQIESSLEDCIPFKQSGSLVFTLGFLLTTLMFLPFGRYQLKETVFIQILSFFCFWTIMAVFHYELFGKVGKNPCGTTLQYGRAKTRTDMRLT